jgi:hypothetical protein
MRALTIIIVAMIGLLDGCSTVKPWDRDLLAEKHMQLVPAPLDNALDEHIFFSKEAASGGQGTGGGGCGCN